MHERGAVGLALAAFLAETEGATIVRVSAEFGPEVDPEVIREVWEHSIDGTHAAGAALALEPAVGEMQCFSCGATYPGTKLEACPACGGSGIPTFVPPELTIVGWGAA